MSAPSRRRPSRRFCGFDLLESRAVPAVVFSPAVTAEVQADTQDFAAGGVPNFLLDQYRVVGNHGTLHLVTSGGGSTFDQQYSNTITRVGGAAVGGFSASDSVDFFLQELSARSADPANGDGSDFSSAGIHIQTESYTTSGNVTAFDLVYTAGGYRFDQHLLMQTTPDSSGGSYATGDAINTFISDLDAHRNEFLNWKYPTPSGTAGSVGNGTATGTTTGTGATGSATASVTHYSRASHVKPGTSLGTNGLTTIGNTSGAGAGTSIIGTQGTTTTGAGIGTGVGNAGTGSGTGLLGSGTGTNTGSGTGTGITGTGTPTSGIGTTGTGTGTNIGPGTTGTGLGTGTIGTGTGTGIGSGITGTGSGIGTGTTGTGTGIGTGTTGTGVGTGITGLGSTISPTASYDLGSSVPGTQDSGIASPSAGPISNLVSPGTPLVNPGPAITTDNGNTIGA